MTDLGWNTSSQAVSRHNARMGSIVVFVFIFVFIGAKVRVIWQRALFFISPSLIYTFRCYTTFAIQEAHGRPRRRRKVRHHGGVSRKPTRWISSSWLFYRNISSIIALQSKFRRLGWASKARASCASMPNRKHALTLLKNSYRKIIT
jgi:hypothetical protein